MIQDVIITDRENVRKCSIHPLIYREDLLFFPSSGLDSREPWQDLLFLHTEGEPLTEQDAGKGLLLAAADHNGSADGQGGHCRRLWHRGRFDGVTR